MTEDQIIRKIAVIFVTDVVSFSTLMEKNENSTLRSLRACRDIMNQLFKKYDARIFNTAGDSVLAEFPNAVTAFVCATEFQKMINKRNLSVSLDLQMQFRIRLNIGDVIVEGTNLSGEGVNNAARLEVLSQPGGVPLSKAIYDFVNKKGAVTQTILTKIDIIVHNQDKNVVNLFVRRSFSQHLFSWMNDAASRL